MTVVAREVRRAFRAGLALALGCSAAPRQPASERTIAPHPYVVLVSFDAFRHDYIDRYQPQAILEVARRGVRALSLIPSFPSKTFPNHYTIITGLYPGDHGIVGNAFFDPDRRAWYRLNNSMATGDSSWYGGEPIWTLAERQGVKTGVYFWPGSEAAIGGVRPSYWTAYDTAVHNDRRVNESVAWLRKQPSERPHLVLLYFSDVDDVTHRTGPLSPETAEAVATVDRALRQLLDSIATLPFRDSVNVVLVSDHGMAAIPPNQVIVVSDLLMRGGVDTTGLEMSDNGPTMSLWFAGDSNRLRRARRVLGNMPRARAYLRSEIPERWHLRENPRAGDLLLVAEEGFNFARRSSDRAPSRGVHGYDPALPDMQGIFVAAGPNVWPGGMMAPFENVHIYPFLAALLKLQRVPVTDGNPAVLRSIVRGTP